MYRETGGGDYKWFEDHPLPRHPSTVLVTAKDRRRKFASRDQIPVGWKLSMAMILSRQAQIFAEEAARVSHKKQSSFM